MGKLKLTTKLNIKVVSVVCVLMFAVILHSQWVSLQEKKASCSKDLIAITDFLSKKMPDKSFDEIVVLQGASGNPLYDQVMAINQQIQPILDSVFVPADIIKFGVYSRSQGRIVAIGPTFDSSLLIGINSKEINDMYDSDTALLGEKTHSFVWYGADIMYHLRPIKVQEKIVGHVFACANLDKVYQDVWKQTINMFFISFIGLMIAIAFFQDVFIRLKKDLELFAAQIIKGDAKNFASELPELTSIFQYISEQTEKMTRLDRLNIIGEMAASIGHEVRNPLTTVRGFLQYIGEKEKFNEYKSHFALMIDEMDRANGIITEFLSLAKNKTMDFQESDLNQVIREIHPLLMADVLRNNCQLQVECNQIKMVFLDKNSLRQLLLNMVRNAIEAMPGGGTVTISTECCQSQVLLTIRDEGVGIPSDLQEKLGTPFFTTKENGTGLGLAVCYRIVHRHNASLLIESHEGKGTAFKIFFNFAS